MRRTRPPATRGRGRPAKLFVITDAGRSAFEHAYDDLATSALRFLAERLGEEAVAEFSRRQLGDLEARYGAAMRAVPPQQRVRALAEALSADGYAASSSTAPAGGQQLCQHHCPVAHVAASFPQLCEAETAAFARLLGVPVQRLATIAHGDGVCTTHVTARELTEKNDHNAGVRRRLRMTTAAHPELEGLGKYKFGWADSDVAGASARRGLSEEVVRDISAQEERAGVDARPSPEGPAPVRQEADAHVGRRPLRRSTSTTSSTSSGRPRSRPRPGTSSRPTSRTPTTSSASPRPRSSA